MLKKILMSTVAVVALGQNLLADDYYNYGTWTPDGHPAVDVGGYIDTVGKLGTPGSEYVFFIDGWSGNTGYIYRVNVAGNPNSHPDVDGNSVAPRTFTLISSHVLSNARASEAEFYIDDSGIYYGSGENIKRWDFDWSNEIDIITNGNIYSQTLAYNKTKNEWWTATIGRDVYKYNDSTNQWVYQFTHPDLAGGHHDGMEIIDNTLYISDMTSDKIIAYDLNQTTGDVIPDSNRTYSYTASPYVEGMGFGPNQHFWMGSGSELYEIGEGSLTTSCTQTFNYTPNWTMQRSKCDNMRVPGFDDTLMVALVNGELVFATGDDGTKAWLEGLGITAENDLTLHTGEGVWLISKSNISKTITTGESRNNYVDFTNGAYRFVGFNIPVDLNDKFGVKPVDSVYYYNGGWHTWTPADGSQILPANQGLYVLPNGDFSILVK